MYACIRHRACGTMWSVRMPHVVQWYWCYSVIRADPPDLDHAAFENRPPNFLVLAALAASRQLQNGPTRLPDGPRLHQDAPRRPQRAPRRTKRASSRPKIGLDDPREHQAAPGGLQDVPRDAPDEPRGSEIHRFSLGFCMFLACRQFLS